MSGSLEQSIRKYSEELATNPKSRVFVPLADAYRVSGRTVEAIEVAKQGVGHHPHYVGGKMALARAYFENGEPDLAQELLENVLNTAPDNLLANRILAEIYKHGGQASKAIPLLKRLLSLEPDNDRVAKDLAALEMMTVPTEEVPSFEEFPSVVEEPPSVSSGDLSSDKSSATMITATMGEMYRSQGHLDEALDVYGRLAEMEPQQSSHRARMADIQSEINARRIAPSGISRAAMLKQLLTTVRERRRTL